MNVSAGCETLFAATAEGYVRHTPVLTYNVVSAFALGFVGFAGENA